MDRKDGFVMKFPTIEEMAKEVAVKAMDEFEIDGKTLRQWINEIEEYYIKKEQGKLLILPCKPGDTIYTNLRVQGWYMRSNKAPYKVTVAFIGINGKNIFFNVVYENDNVFQFSFSDIGKTVFLTEQEAREALEGMKE